MEESRIMINSKEYEELTLREKLKKHGQIIFLLELAGLLHDTGKLDSRFIDYRKKWQKHIDGWNYNNDPHDNNYFDIDRIFQKEDFNVLSALMNRTFDDICGAEQVWIAGKSIPLDISLKDLMQQHTNPIHKLAMILNCGDSIDSAYDRNNPLFVNEQMESMIYKATVFGYETPINVDVFDKTRESLYHKLQQLLKKYLIDFDSKTRREIFRCTEKAFKVTVSDTIRPANDATLWQHSYMTSALTKTFFLHFLIYGERIEKFTEGQFAIIGSGWDGLNFISKGHKVGDVVSRKELIYNLKHDIKHLIEYDYPIGMNIYDDDNGIYFIVPKLDEDGSEYSKLIDEIEEKVNSIANDITDGEIQPNITKVVKGTRFITEVVRSISDIREKSKYPYSSGRCSPSWVNNWQNMSDRAICDVCGKRPAKLRTANICDTCIDRRKAAQKLRDKRHSIFSGEIADKHGRLALITAKFSLEPWLRGDMLWSLFVKEAKSLDKALQHLEKIEDFKDTDKKRKEIIQTKIQKKIEEIKDFYNYNEIKKHIDICNEITDPEFAKAISFLFDRHKNELMPPQWNDLDDWRQEMSEILQMKQRFSKDTDLYNYILTKNHTPSRILNAWNTTRDFFGDICTISSLEQEGLLSPFKRIKLILDELGKHMALTENAVYDAEINGEDMEVFRNETYMFVVNQGNESRFEKVKEHWRGKIIKIKQSEFEKNKGQVVEAEIRDVLEAEIDIYPYRIITSTPDILMAIVPADKALELSDYIYAQYKKHFGKVIGRLPFSIGNIFFPEKMPMFVVLDSGRRMLSNFERINLEYWNRKEEWEIKEDVQVNKGVVTMNFKNNIQWQVNCSLGTEKMDFFHPYLIVKDSEDNKHKKEMSCFETFLGDLVHFSEVKKGYKLRVCPNYYDFEFLDSNTRRYDINLDADKRRKSNVADFKSKPFLLDELGQKIMCLWLEQLQGKHLKGITDTKLRNLQALWLTKYQEWVSDDNPDGISAWKQFVTCSLQQEFSIDKDSQQYASLMETIENGLFFDTLELYLGILKERIETK